MGKSNGTDALLLYQLHFDGITNTFHFKSNSATVDLTSTTVAVANRWYHVAATYNAAGLVSTLYIDGVSEATGLAGAAQPAVANPMRVGGRGANYFNGQVDEVRIWNTVRSGAQINANMFTQIGRAHV